MADKNYYENLIYSIHAKHGKLERLNNKSKHSPLLAAYLHCIGRRDSATCPHCNGADETAEHLVLHCTAHDQAWWESWPNIHYQSDPRAKTPMELPGEDWGGDPSPRPGMRKR